MSSNVFNNENLEVDFGANAERFEREGSKL